VVAASKLHTRGLCCSRAYCCWYTRVGRNKYTSLSVILPIAVLIHANPTALVQSRQSLPARVSVHICWFARASPVHVHSYLNHNSSRCYQRFPSVHLSEVRALQGGGEGEGGEEEEDQGAFRGLVERGGGGDEKLHKKRGWN